MYKTILITTDLQESSHEVLREAASIASKFNADIYILHVIEPPASTVYAASLGFAEYTNPVPDDAKVVLNTLGDELNIPPERQLVKVGPVKTLIYEVAQQLAADLIIVGSHTKKVFEDLVGTTANAVVQGAQCDVLTVRNKHLT